jgi:hypothetical protein
MVRRAMAGGASQEGVDAKRVAVIERTMRRERSGMSI